MRQVRATRPTLMDNRSGQFGCPCVVNHVEGQANQALVPLIVGTST